MSLQVHVQFHSYFRELTGCPETTECVEPGSDLGQLLKQLHARYPQLARMQHSTLIAVGLDYQDRAYKLKEGDEVSLFPPVQGG
jgi:MoaD family protein